MLIDVTLRIQVPNEAACRDEIRRITAVMKDQGIEVIKYGYGPEQFALELEGEHDEVPVE